MTINQDMLFYYIGAIVMLSINNETNGQVQKNSITLFLIYFYYKKELFSREKDGNWHFSNEKSRYFDYFQ